MDIRQTKIAAGIAVGKPFVIKTQQVQHRGVQIVNGRAIFDGAKTEIVGGTVNRPALDSPTGHPQGESPVVMVSAL